MSKAHKIKRAASRAYGRQTRRRQAEWDAKSAQKLETQVSQLIRKRAAE